MALGTYFNWDTLQTPNSEINTFHEPTPELALDNYYNNHNHNIFNYSDESLFLSNTLFDPYFDPTLFSIPEFYPPQQLLSCPSSYDPFISLTEDYNFPCPKRQKCLHEEQELVDPSSQELIIPSNFFVPNYPCSLQEEELQELFYAVPEFKVPELPQGTTCVGSADFQCEKKTNERTISAQSIAARERRRKITEKTQELGKLVPGGPKMNTAEMLHAAAKYVKYLQAQVGMLELMKTLNVTEDKKGPPSEELHTMVVSPFVQEKLYSEEMCFVPKELVTTLTNHNDVQSRPSILKDLKQLIETDIEKKPKQE
ncbi:transcription factor bHLH52-like [Gastrolobium bilobum]|uniref:transcription factor bHLH52-like n=1 Tax=Gastrolobium bilobum TaxID=150636 RepID=UPI002AB254C1|nr:transcription factor bHLH52-like [Gastrolobium bilobum]